MLFCRINSKKNLRGLRGWVGSLTLTLTVRMIVPRLRAQRSAALLPFVEDYFAEVFDVRSINLAQGGGAAK